MNEKVTVGALQQMKRDGRKIVGVVAWDYQIAAIADRVGVEIVSVGDSVGVNLWGHRSPLEVTLAEMIIVGRAVRRAVTKALVSVDIPFGPVQEGTDSAVRAAVRLAKEAGADLVKIDGAADFPAAVTAVTRAGIPVWAQLGVTPQTALRHGVGYEAMLAPGARVPAGMTDDLIADARGSRRRAPPCSTSPTRGRSRAPRSRGRSASRSSAARAAARGSTGGSGWRTPPSVTPRGRWTTSRTATRTSPRSPWTY